MPWKPEFQSDLARNILQPFPLPNDALYKIWLQSAPGGSGRGGGQVGGGGQGGYERRIEVFVKMQKKMGGGGGSGWM